MEEQGVKLLGANPETIKKAEDRQAFKDTMLAIGEPCIPSKVVEHIDDALAFAEEIGYPVIVRPAFTLGGTGGGIAYDKEQLHEIGSNGLRLSPITQVLIEKCIAGWKEIEYEVVRDSKGNVITVCNMENVDPVVPESVVASAETTENEKNAEEFGRETLAETSVPQGAANSAGHEMVTSGTDKVPGGEAAVSQSGMPTEAAGSQTETVAGQPEAIQNQPVEYTDLQQITLDPDWEYADHSKINTGAAVLYRAPEECGRKGIIIGVNAGHGTAGGAKVKTLCHPDGSAKTTGGSTAAGATEAAAVSGGMTFQDGTPERTVTLQMAQILRDKLLASGYDVLMLRDGEDVQLDNVARTVICNNVADCHIALHWDSGDSKNYDKGCFYISVPEVLKSMEPVASHWQQHDALGADLVEGLRGQGVTIYGKGNMSIDLTQTSYSTIPSVDMELGNAYSDHSDAILDQLAEGLLQGINVYFQQQ